MPGTAEAAGAAGRCTDEWLVLLQPCAAGAAAAGATQRGRRGNGWGGWELGSELGSTGRRRTDGYPGGRRPAQDTIMLEQIHTAAAPAEDRRRLGSAVDIEEVVRALICGTGINELLGWHSLLSQVTCLSGEGRWISTVG